MVCEITSALWYWIENLNIGNKIMYEIFKTWITNVRDFFEVTIFNQFCC